MVSLITNYQSFPERKKIVTGTRGVGREKKEPALSAARRKKMPANDLFTATKAQPQTF
jgi:hypothetical protein